jgi:nitronate monooxygenase
LADFRLSNSPAAVSNLGGLGSLGAVTLGSSAITEVIEEIRSLTTKPFAINLWVSASDRQAAHIGSDVIQGRIRALTRYYTELGIEPPSQVESKAQDFESQVRAAVDARPAVLSFIYGIPPAEILDECRKHAIRTIGTATTPEEANRSGRSGIRVHSRVQLRRGRAAAHFFVPPRIHSCGAFR